MDLETIKLEDYCRTCLSTTSEFASILENSVVDLLTEYTTVQIHPDDEYSKMICQMCMQIVQEFHTFKLKCLETDRLLRNGCSSDFHSLPSKTLKVEVETSLDDTFSSQIDHDIVSTHSSDSEFDKESVPKNQRCHTFECTLCAKKFRRKYYLLRHVKQTHEKNALDVVVKTETDQKFEEKHVETDRDTKKNAKISLVKTETEESISEPVKQHICPKCSRNLSSLKGLKKHLLRHENKNSLVNRTVRAAAGQKKLRRFACQSCPRVFSKLHYLTKHEERHSDFSCPLVETEKCSEPLETLAALTIHIKTKHLDFVPKVKCQKCGVAFFVQKQLDNHEARHHADGFCTQCDVVVPELGRHNRKYHAGPVKMYKCDDCDRTFRVIRNFEAHKKVHANGGDGRTICIHCGIKIVSIDDHIRCKHPEMIPGFNKLTMTCKYCCMQFTSLKELLRHSKAVHKEERAKLAGSVNCSKCEKVFTNRSGLRAHFRYSHTDVKKTVCNVCGHVCARKEHLKQHMRVHTDERPFECDLCPRKFKSSASLQDHRRTHTGERPHVCDICQKGFCQRSAMTTHRRLHGKIPTD